MLKLTQISIFGPVKTYLQDQQNVINNKPSYEEKVNSAKNSWESKNRNHFQSIRDTLDLICCGARRCHYCEDSAADEVEHIWPKAFFPEKTFVWQNYLFSCGPCNGSHKKDKFAVFDQQGNQFDITRLRNLPVVPPTPGNPMFIDPAYDDPTDFITLDLTTGLFVPRFPIGTSEYKRAVYTLKTLGLNERDYLSKARRSAYAGYKDALVAYDNLKKNGGSASQLKNKRNEIAEKHHPSVWNEMKVLARQQLAHGYFFNNYPELYTI
ncbi:hypothetical protein [Pantoea sp. CTOTU50773]|uniref:hypothetical protein n=1 Tax=Pantoea sp. CTOTU50773 TaxID=2953853 RepID=UPI0028AF4C06|nr:hypothetical protein [Pantoea sp. CTOTU50773]